MVVMGRGGEFLDGRLVDKWLRERERETGVVRVAKVFVVARGVLEGILDARRGVVCSGKRKN